MKVGFTILTYMNYQDTFDCVRTLVGVLNSYSLNPLQISIALIDNASPNDVGDKLVAYSSSLQTPHWVDVKILQTSENQGYGNGNNIGLKYLFGKRN